MVDGWSEPALAGDEQRPPAVTALAFDVDQHKLHCAWKLADGEDDIDGDKTFHDDLHHCLIRVYEPGGSLWRNTTWRVGLVESKTFKIKKPLDGTYTLKVLTVDPSGNKSSGWASAPSQDSSLAQPPQPGVVPQADITFDRGGKRGLRVKIQFTYGQGTAFTDDDIDHFVVEIQAEPQSPVSGDPVRRRIIDVKRNEVDDQQTIHYDNIKAGHYVRVRYRVVDKKGHKSEWSAWSGDKLAQVTRKPGKVQNKQVIKRTHGITVKWDPPAGWLPGTVPFGTEAVDFTRLEVAEYEVTLKKDGVVWDTIRTKSNRVHFAMEKSDMAGTPKPKWRAKVETVSHENEVITDAVETNEAEAEEVETSDGLVPSSSPTPTAFGHLNSIMVQWNNINNHDPIVFELHMGTSAGFTPSTSTVITEVGGAANSLEKLAVNVTKTVAGADLNPATTYYFKTRSKDIDGNAAAYSSVSNGVSPSGVSVDTGDVSTDGITPNAPGSPTATPAYKGILMSWPAVTNTKDPLIYEVWDSGGSVKYAETHALGALIQNLNTNQSYTFKVRARSSLSGLTGSYSSTASATTLTLPPADMVAGGLSADWTITGSLYVPNSFGARVEINGDGSTYLLAGYNSSNVRQFSIDNAGNAYFAGQLSAATGSFSGSISASTISGSSFSTVNSAPRGASAVASMEDAEISFAVQSAGVHIATIQAGAGAAFKANLFANCNIFAIEGVLEVDTIRPDSSPRVTFDAGLRINPPGGDSFDGIYFDNAMVATTAGSGGSGAPPAQVAGYIRCKVNGIDRKIPYYAT